MIEEWRPVEGYEGLYEVSNLGRVRSVDRYVVDSLENRRFYKGKVLSPGIRPDGYLFVILSCNGKSKTINVHRIVAQAFIPNFDNLPMVNHKDEDKSNNRVDNLEWCNAKYNNTYGTRQDKVRETAIKNGYWTGLRSGLSRDEYNKNYYQDNKDKIKDNSRIYYQKNRYRICEQHKEYAQKYYQENKDRICERKKENYRKKKEMIQNNVKSLND